jgi:hypothetical protein
VRLGDEFEACAWVKPEALEDFDLNEQSRATFSQLGMIG